MNKRTGRPASGLSCALAIDRLLRMGEQALASFPIARSRASGQGTLRPGKPICQGFAHAADDAAGVHGQLDAKSVQL
jgi:hypothetical protein